LSSVRAGYEEAALTVSGRKRLVTTKVPQKKKKRERRK
jgi:hypothetical protein